MPYTTITPAEAKPVANYKMATRMEGGRLLYIAGQVARDAEGDVLGKGDIRTQARQVFQNLRNVLQAAGGDLSRPPEDHDLHHQYRGLPGSGRDPQQYLPR